MTDDESALSLFTVPAVFLNLCPLAEFPTHFEGTREKQLQTQHEEHCITLNEQCGAVQHDSWRNHRRHFTSTAVPSSIKCKNKPLMEESDGVVEKNYDGRFQIVDKFRLLWSECTQVSL